MVTPYQFQCDYIAGCTPQIMDALLHHNLTEVPGYCEDMFCKEAEAKIREACKSPDAGVFFFAGGTICNLSLISAVLRPWQGVLAAPSGTLPHTKREPSKLPATRCLKLMLSTAS